MFLNKSEDLQKQLIDSINSLEHTQAHLSCRKIVEGVDTVCNLTIEINNKKLKCDLMLLPLNSIILNDNKYQKLKPNLLAEVGIDAVERLQVFIKDFATAINYVKTRGHWVTQIVKSIATVFELFKYCSERRKYFVTYLSLIPQFSSGTTTMSDAEYLEFEIFNIETLMIQLTTARNIMLMDTCYDDFELKNNNGTLTWNKDFSHLENNSFEPQRLSLLDQIEFRKIDCFKDLTSSKSSSQMFSFDEVENTIALYDCVYKNYNVDNILAFIEIKKIVTLLRKYVVEDYKIIIPENEFNILQSQFQNLNLSETSNNYFDHLNSFSPFTSSVNVYYSNAMLFTRFITNLLTIKLEKRKRFQIHSGFIFEDRVIEILECYGFKNSGVTRINRKEFDLITTRNGEIHNFQCKNNLFEISLIDSNIKKTAQINSKLCTYYDAAFKKEKDRESLIKKKIGLNKVTHYVVSRFPVMTNQKFVICFNELENWLRQNFDES